MLTALSARTRPTFRPIGSPMGCDISPASLIRCVKRVKRVLRDIYAPVAANSRSLPIRLQAPDVVTPVWETALARKPSFEAWPTVSARIFRALFLPSIGLFIRDSCWRPSPDGVLNMGRDLARFWSSELSGQCQKIFNSVDQSDGQLVLPPGIRSD